MPLHEHNNEERSAARQQLHPDARNSDHAAEQAATGSELQQPVLPIHAMTQRQILALQRTIGNRAVGQLLSKAVQRKATGSDTLQRLMYAEGKDMTGKTLIPHTVNNGTGKNANLKWNKGGGVSGKGKYNTGFWEVQEDTGLELHVHFSDKGGLVASGGVAHHFKRGAAQKGTASNDDLKNVFGSTTVTNWTDASYKIK